MGSSPGFRPAEDPKVFEDLAVEQLRSKGFRITMPRLQVIRVLANSHRALSAYDIHERILAGDGRIDVVSVYRILATLREVGMIHHIGVVDGYLACRIGEEHSLQMEHAVCTSCGNVTEVEVPSEVLGKTQGQMEHIGFLPETVKIEVLGLCSTCRNAGAHRR